MKRHTLTLLGNRTDELRVPAAVLVEAISALMEGACQATRFAVEGESTRKGPRPAWLDAACQLDIRGLTAGSAVLAVDAPVLDEVAPERFGRNAQETGEFVAIPAFKGQTAVDLLGQVLAAVAEGDAEGVLADRALLDTCARLARVGGGSYRGISLAGVQNRTKPIELTDDDVPKIELLRDKTPPPQAVRVAGVLDTVSASKDDLYLALPDGTKIRARHPHDDLSVLRRLWGKRVAISGIAHYRPSGQLLHIDAEELVEAREADALFMRPPFASTARPVARHVSQDESSGVAAFFGIWPGEETEAELLEALRDLE